MRKNNASEIRKQLRRSLDVSTIRFELLIFVVPWLILATLALIVGDGIEMVVLLTVMFAPAVVYELIRLLRIFREPEEYVLCKAQLEKPRHQPLSRGVFTFCAVIDTEQIGQFLVVTNPIFVSHGFGAPLMEDYLGKTVTIAWNRETGMVVVIE